MLQFFNDAGGYRDEYLVAQATDHDPITHGDPQVHRIEDPLPFTGLALRGQRSGIDGMHDEHVAAKAVPVAEDDLVTITPQPEGCGNGKDRDGGEPGEIAKNRDSGI